MKLNKQAWLWSLSCALLLGGATADIQAQDEQQGYIKLITHNVPGKKIYKVSIRAIDGSQQQSALSTAVVSAGEHTVSLAAQPSEWTAAGVRTMPREEWILDLKIDVKPNTTYIVAGQLLPKEAVEPDGPIWKPIVYKTIER